jgi:hypothetical protein
MTMTAPRFTATGPDVLGRAAVLLPAVVGPWPMLGGDLRTAFMHSIRMRGADDSQAHRLADEATEMFAAWLVEIGEADGNQPASRVLRGWLGARRMSTVVYALRAAAEHWRAELIAARDVADED